MSVSNRTLYGVIALLVATVIIVSSVAALYYVKYNQASTDNAVYVRQLEQLGVKYDANILIDYGNGTRDWYNSTSLQPGSNLYTATVLALNGNVNASYYQQYQEHLLTGIGGVEQTSTKSWFLWTFNPNNSTSPWQIAQTGPDLITIVNGGDYAWTFCGMDANYNPICTP
jgi:hypothetical protein